MDERQAMQQAMMIAGAAHPHPNPRVGAVVLGHGEYAGSGFHAGPGADHAEVVALNAAGSAAAGATLTVTLEPCVHTGLTPPCTKAIIDAGIGRVVVGALDPDPRVSGRGVARLEEAGIDVVVHDDGAAESVDPGYFHQRRTGRPRVTLKSALTLDGQTAAADGTARWITSQEARNDGHRLRAEADAILVGAGTVRADDPALTVRLDGYTGHQPRPVIVAGSQPLPEDAALWASDPIVLAPEDMTVAGDVIVAGDEGRIDFAAALDALGERGIVDLLIEGGATVAAALLREGLVDRAVFYLAAALAGGQGRGVFEDGFATIGDLRPITIAGVTRVGPDLRIDIEFKEH